MAMLKDTVVAGSLRATDSLLATTVQMQILNIPTASNGTTFGPGTNGQVLKSNGTSVYWASDNDTNKYHKTGTWSGLTYTATAVNSADALAFTIPTGTSSTTVALGNHTHNYAGSDSAGGAANNLKNFTTTTTTSTGLEITTSVIGYISGLTKADWNYQQTDGSIYGQFYNDKWKSEIFQDYRTGQLSVRGKNNGTWQDWRRILDETNYTTFTVTKTGTGASGTWGISISGTAANANYLKDLGRKDNANLAHVTDGGVQLLLATSTMTNNKPSSDGFILHFHWDTSSAWDSQLFISDSGSAMQYRGSSAAGTWAAWKTLIDSSNYTSYTVTKTGSGASGTWGISISGTAAKATGDASGNAIASTYLKLAGGTLTGRLTTTKAINQIITGSGTAASDKGSGVSPRYFPAKWTFNTGLTPTNGDTFVIKIPVAGHDYGVFLSINNGTSYHPVVANGTGRITTHYPVNTYIQVVFESSGSAADVFALNGADARSTVTGGVWRVLNYYDANNRDYGVRTYRQTSGYNDDYPLLVSRTLAASIGTVGTNGSSTNNIYAVLWNDTTKTPTLNPSTGLMKVKDLKVNHIFNNYITGSGTAGTAGSSTVTYVPSKWTFNLGVATPQAGDTVTIKIPVAGVNSGVYMSTDNGTTYYPVAIDYGASRLTTHFPVNSVITLVFQTGIATTVYPLAGGTATSSVNNGRWQVVNYYNTNTTYSALSQADANTGTATTARLITAAVLNTKITNRLQEVPTLSLTASKSSWSSSSPYTQTITATGVTASNSIVVGLGTSLTEDQYDAAADAKIICSAQAANSITLKCLGDKPTVDIPISVLVMT